MTYSYLNVLGKAGRSRRFWAVLFAIPIFLALSAPWAFAQTNKQSADPAHCPPLPNSTLVVPGPAKADTSSDGATKPADQTNCSSGQAQSNAEKQAPGPSSGEFNMFDHSQPSRLWISGQFNSIMQANPGFHSPYSGPESFKGTPEFAWSRVSDLFLGYQVLPHTELFFDEEEFNGTGLSSAFGLAGFSNMDVVRNPSLGPKPYVARFGIHTVIPLSDETVDNDRSWSNFADKLPAKRIEIRVGKFSAVDFLDPNSIGSDSHKQFMNWAVDNNLAYDYPADTRGYTYGIEIEYDTPHFSTRFMEGLMPTVANGLQLDWNVGRARSETLEFEYRPELMKGRQTAIRFLTFVNHANMGDYAQAIKLFEEGKTSVPDITATRHQGTVKYGFGLNLEQEIADGISVYSRLGWNEGQHESFTYSEVNNTVSAGMAFAGKLWGRTTDKAGFALVSNGLSKEHAEYLTMGGLGFVLGDGKLNYGRENILETYYTAHLWKGMYAGPDVQFVQNPGYNRDRGPVPIFGMRFHVDF